MTPDQLLGLQRHARARTQRPEGTLETADGVPTVIASGTQESVPITVGAMIVETARGSEPAIAPAQPLDEVIAELEAKFAPPARPAARRRLFVSTDEAGAIFGFALFGAWTLVEVAMLLAR
jgi:hypothetical protein